MKGALHPRIVMYINFMWQEEVVKIKGLIGWKDCIRSEERHVKIEGELLLGVMDVVVTEKMPKVE